MANLKPPRETLPDGESAEWYERTERWSNTRWAWEFLRRNVKYQHACDLDARAHDPIESALVARQFGLNRLKHYLEPWAGKGVPLSEFVVASVAWEANLESPSPIPAQTRPDIRLAEVWIKFDLSVTMRDRAVLESLLATAERVLDSCRQQVRLNFGVRRRLPRVPTTGAGDPRLYPRHLRILDLLRAAKENEAAGRPARSHRAIIHLMNQGSTGVQSSDDAWNNYKGQIKDAELAATKYLSVLLGRARKRRAAPEEPDPFGQSFHGPERLARRTKKDVEDHVVQVGEGAR